MVDDRSSELRKRKLNTKIHHGKCVIYVMSRDQRVADNHALLAAQKSALELEVPLAVIFCLYPHIGRRAREHYEFMLAGLREVEDQLEHFRIPFIMVIGTPFEMLQNVCHHYNPSAVYFDFSPLRGARSLQEKLARTIDASCVVVDTHNVVPAWEASNKQEYAARTIRPKLHKRLTDFLIEPPALSIHPYAWSGKVQSIKELGPILTSALDKTISNGTKIVSIPGEKSARAVLMTSIYRLKTYADHRNDPSIADGQSELSPYLHYGTLSSLRVMREVQSALQADPSIQAGADAFIEEIFIRKELSDNFCFYNDHYDSLDGAADWAKKTLEKHRQDPREPLYDYATLVAAETHDPGWNAAQLQLRRTGKMHGYMRMYWAKKVLEWTESPEQAIEYLIRMNDFFSIDGGDPNGYVGILWSVAGVHDRPWGERPIYGTIRSMVYAGLKRKFDIETYQSQYK